MFNLTRDDLQECRWQTLEDSLLESTSYLTVHFQQKNCFLVAPLCVRYHTYDIFFNQ